MCKAASVNLVGGIYLFYALTNRPLHCNENVVCTFYLSVMTINSVVNIMR